MVGVFRFLNRWSNLIAILISVAALSLSAASYLSPSSKAAEKVNFHKGLVDKTLSQMFATCKESKSKVDFSICRKYANESESEIEDLKTIVGQEAAQLSADDYKDAWATIGLAEATLAAVRESFTFNPKKSQK